MAVRALAPDRPVWFEHEGGHVGHCIVPKAIQNWVLGAPRGHFVVVRMAKEHRVERLVQVRASPHPTPCCCALQHLAWDVLRRCG